jgi:hypothetical protein
VRAREDGAGPRRRRPVAHARRDGGLSTSSTSRRSSRPCRRTRVRGRGSRCPSSGPATSSTPTAGWNTASSSTRAGKTLGRRS